MTLTVIDFTCIPIIRFYRQLMQWIFIVLGFAAIAFFQLAMLIYVAPALAIGCVFFIAVRAIFGLKEGSAGLILNFILSLGIAAFSLWYLVLNSPAGQKYFG
ncbi:MAG: hypothetical protein C4535_11075 [Comamonadaceae bacterium]|nr:MAG: hypothetical protein C4535_11075 [Comamonadaceae bacterium]